MPNAPHAILLAAFGSRLPGAEAALDALRLKAQQLYPEHLVATALTSGTVRRHKGGQGRHAPSPEETLRGLLDQGVRRLAVQSLHVVPGEEFRNLERLVDTLSGPGGFERIALGRPLLGNAEDVRRAAGALMSVLPRERGPGEAVLLMAHGTRGRAREMYVDLGRELRARDGLVLIGSLEHGSGLAGVLPELRALGVGTVHLMPLLFSRGKHATRDMAGEGEHSWRSQLTRAGFACQAHVQGAGEKPALADIWLDHLREAVARLEQ